MDPRSAKDIVDYAGSLDCIHCGMCVTSCPTWKITGVESSSPRGRIHLMRAVAEGQLEPDKDYVEEMEFCLLCRHCESVCPSGVKFGAMMEIARDGISTRVGRPLRERFLRWLGFRVLLFQPGLLRIAATLVRFAQGAGLKLSAPAFPPAAERRPLPPLTPARGERIGSVAILEGCVMPLLYGRVNRATVDVLAQCGLDVRCPEPRGCCGSLHAHNGDLEGARTLAKRTIEAFESVPGEIVVNSAGCSAHMKDYAHLLEHDEAWKERAKKFVARVRDFSEYLASDRCRAKLLETRGPPRTAVVAYDDPCHLCHGQGIRSPPRQLLDAIPGLRRVEMQGSESCCGSAGIYSLLRPSTAAEILDPKIRAFVESGASTLVTANPGCQMQWEAGFARAGVDARVVHLAEILRESRSD
ncbi:MAG: (Fe-S)-binding protein [Planctomycetota bacterium]